MAKAAPPETPEVAEMLTPVRVVSPHRGSIAAYFETTSRVEAENRVEILSKGTGQCTAVFVDIGDTVASGDVLAVLEKEELEAQVRQARISMQQQKTAYEIAERSFKEGIAASVDRDNTRFAYEQARVALEMAELQLDNQTIYAPINGIITRSMIQEGMIITPGVPVFSIVDPNSYVLPISVPEKELARLHKGQKALVRIDAFPEEVFNAQIRRIYPSIDPMSGTVKVLLDFEEKDRKGLREAAFARIQLIMNMREDALLLPRDTVMEEDGRKFVFIVTSQEGSAESRRQVAKKRSIVVGIEQKDVVEVLEGVEDQTKVVIMGQHSLKPETPVRITNLEQEMADRAEMTVDEALEAAGKRDTTLSGDRSGRAHDSLPF